nr:hypothetical protein [Edaphobacter aggregans]
MRPERMAGQPVETAWRNLDSRLPMEWTTVSLTESPKGSRSMAQREMPSALSSGESWWRQARTRRRGGSYSTISPESATRPSGSLRDQAEPGFQVVS